MAAAQKERSARPAEKRQELGEQELRHTVPYGTRQMLDELMLWHEIEEVSEAVQLLVMNGRLEALTAELGEMKDRATIWRLIAHAHSLGADQSASYFKIKRHVLCVSENVARKLRQAGFAESLQMNADDGGDND
ncbi:hypothetical protein [Pseudomonas lundensis]|uniref:hypothetical protein n=1 Tax=Pseudomonas lundensis TaxID=86185 RepID=UPI000642840B|nr:hypothetical protein [Pseudomonas lundensis]